MGSTTVSKNKQGYGYKYTDLSQIHEFLESIGWRYYQYIEPVGDIDYIYTVPIEEKEDGSIKEYPPRRGCRVVQATLSGKSNPAQENGSAITYARRYSLLMAFGLATDDDDAESLSKYDNKKSAPKNTQQSTPKNTQPKEQQNTPTEEELNKQMVDSVDKRLLPSGEIITQEQLELLYKEMARTKINAKTILSFAKVDAFEKIPQATFIGIMSKMEKTPDAQ